MAKHWTPYLVCRSGVYYFRKALPAIPRKSLPVTEIKFSLKTKDIKLAKRLARELASFMDESVTKQWNMAKLTKQTIKAMAQDYFEDLWSKWAEQAEYLDDPAQISENIRGAEEVKLELTARLKKHDYKSAYDAAQALMKENRIDEPFASHKEICDEFAQYLVRARYEAQCIYQQLLGGHYYNTEIKDPLFKECEFIGLPPIKGEDPAFDHNTTIQKVIEQYIKEKNAFDAWSKTFHQQNKRILGYFAEVIGTNKRLKRVTREDVTDFYDILKRLPPNFEKNPKYAGMSLQEVALSNTGKTTTQGTILKNYTILKSFMNWARDDGLIDSVPKPKQKLKKLPQKDMREPFSSEQLNKIFHAPLYTGCRNPLHRNKAGTMVIQDGRYWMPLVALFTGARAGELLQLIVADFKKSGDIYYLDLINDNSDDGSGSKRIKTHAGRRIMPLHPTLVELGFHTYCKRIQGKNTRLFHDIYAPDGRPSKQYSRTFREMLEAIDAKTDKTSFHSFRHNFKDALADADIFGPPVQTLLGHALEGVSETSYGSTFKIEKLYGYVSKIKYDVDLTRLLTGARW